MSDLAKIATSLVPSSSGRTAEDYRAELEAIGNSDPEAGHGIADDLAEAVLRAIADGHPNPQQLAADTLTVLGADFPRWYA